MDTAPGIGSSGTKRCSQGRYRVPESAGSHGAQSGPTQGNDLGSPGCCIAEDGSRIILGHKQQLEEFLYMH